MTQRDFSRTLSGTLVHRTSVAEVFVTAVARRDESTFEAAAQLPRYHAFYHDNGAAPVQHDPMLLVEVLRQASIAFTHEFFAVPQGEQFVWRSVELQVIDPAVLAVHDTPTNVVVRCRVLRRFAGRRGLTGLLVRCAVLLDERETVVAELSYRWMSRQEWDALRAASREAVALPPLVGEPGRQPARIAAGLVGRGNPYNVVISPLSARADGRHRCGVVVDLTHPTLFDHPLDHLPGMLQLEAFRQFAVAAAGNGGPARGTVAALSARFNGFVELDLPCECSGVLSSAGDEIEVRCSLSQTGRQLVDAEIRLAAPAGWDGAHDDRAVAAAAGYARSEPLWG